MKLDQEATTREQILTSAEELFRGRTGAPIRFTVGELAENLELHYTAIYHYFESKDHIVKELIELACARRSTNLGRAQAAGGTALDQLLAFIRLELRQAPTDLLVRSTLLLKSPYQEQANHAFKVTTQEIEEQIRSGIADGSMRDCSPTVVARLLTSILNRYANQREPNLMGLGLTSRKIADQIVELVRSGVAQDPAVFWKVSAIQPVELPVLSLKPSKFDQMQTALTLAFNKLGYEATSIPRVAASIGVSKTSFYKYASSKDGLLYLCARHGVDLIAQIRQISKIVASSPLQTLLYNLYFLRRVLIEKPGPFLLPAHTHSLSEQHQLVVWAIFDQTRENLREVFEEGIRSGEIRELDIYAILPAFGAFSLVPLKASQAGFDDEVARFFALGIAARP